MASRSTGTSGFTAPTKEKLMRRQINAEELERAVIAVVKGMLLSATALRARFVDAIMKQRKSEAAAVKDLAKLEANRQKLTKRMETISEMPGTPQRESDGQILVILPILPNHRNLACLWRFTVAIRSTRL